MLQQVRNANSTVTHRQDESTYTHGSPNIVQYDGAGAVDELRLLLGTVVRPQDDVAIAVLSELLTLGDDDWLTVHVGDCERACRVEAEPFDLRWRDLGLLQTSLDTLAHPVPDVVR